MRLTVQEEAWVGDLGREYTDRNTLSALGLDELYRDSLGVTRRELNDLFLSDVPRDARILEVGCNIGMQLRHLQLMGFTDLHGVELQQYAIDRLCVENVSVRQGAASPLPFKDKSFDLVFTSGLLIHIPIHIVGLAVGEIVRVARSWIWGFEYYAPYHEPIRDWVQEDMVWADDFPPHFVYKGEHSSPSEAWKLTRRWSRKYASCDWVADMYLLERTECGS